MTDTDPSELGPPSEHEAYAMRLDKRLAKIEDNLARIVDTALKQNNKFVQSLFDSISGELSTLNKRLDSVESKRNVAPWVVAGSVAALVVSMVAIGIATANRITLEVSRGAPVECVR